MKDNNNTQIKTVQMTTAVPIDSDIAVYQFITTKKHLQGWGGGYLRINNDALLILFAAELTGKDAQVLHCLLYHCEWENVIRIPQSAIAEELGSTQSNISKSVRKLISLDLLKVIDTDGRKNIYMLNPHYFLKSKAKNHAELITKYDRPTTQ